MKRVGEGCNALDEPNKPTKIPFAVPTTMKLRPPLSTANVSELDDIRKSGDLRKDDVRK